MKRTMKSVFAVMLCIMMLAGSVSVAGSGMVESPNPFSVIANAGTADKSGTWTNEDKGSGTWELNENGVLSIEGTGDFCGADFSSFQVSDVKGIVAVEGVRKLGDSVFQNYTDITKVTLADSIEALGRNAFSGCTSLKEVVTGKSSKLISLDDSCFMNCTSLEKFDLPAALRGLGNAAFYGCKLKEVVIPDGMTTISSAAFYNCASLEKVTLPESLTIIGQSVFNGCISLKEVIFLSGGGITQISSYSFNNCTSLESIILPPTIQYIDSDAFDNCTALKTVYFPLTDDKWNNVHKYSTSFPVTATIITSGSYSDYEASYGLDGCKITAYKGTAEDLIFPQFLRDQPITSIDECVLEEDSALKKLIIPGSIKTLIFASFESAPNLTDVTLLEGVEKIGAYAFKNCSKLENITIPDSVTMIDNCVFSGCSSLKKVTIPDSVTELGFEVFSNCHNLTEIYISNCIVSLKNSVFNYCANLIKITGGCSAEIDPDAFSGVEIDAITFTTCPNSRLFSFAVANGAECIEQHFYTKKGETVAPTCTEYGYTPFLCFCGNYEKKDKVAALDHDYIDHEAKPHTCTEDGWAAYKTCSRCDYCDKVVIPASHSITHYEGKAKTCTEPGYKPYDKCSECSYSTYEEIPASHDFEWVYQNDATTEADGHETQTCHCGATGETRVKEGTRLNANAVIRVAGETTLDWRTKVTIAATATGISEGFHLEMVIGDKTYIGTRTEVESEETEIKGDIIYTVKVVNDGTGEEHASLTKQDNRVKCNAGFFAKLAAFFKGLFRLLPQVTVKP